MSTVFVVCTAGPDSVVRGLPTGSSSRRALWLDSCPGLESTWIMSVPAQ